MRILIWTTRFIVFLLLLSFVVKNSEMVSLTYYLGYEYQLPLSVVLLITFGLGISTAYLTLLGNKFNKGR